jgi:hypothetical protein
MAQYDLDYLSDPQTLRSIEPNLLLKLLRLYREPLERRGIQLTSAASIDHDKVVEVLMDPTPAEAELADVVYLLDGVSGPEDMDRLLPLAEALNIPLGDSPTPPEVALRIWFGDRSLVERAHAESQLTRVRRFEYWFATTPEPPPWRTPTVEALAKLEEELGEWFNKKKRGRRNRVFVFDKGDEIWFLVRHGDPRFRAETIEDSGESAVVYRPAKYAVLVYSLATGGLAINAGPKGEKELYRRKVGLHLFGDEDLFHTKGYYSLKPLQLDQEASLNCREFLEELEWVRLREITLVRGSNEFEIWKAGDVFAAYRRRNPGLPKKVPIKSARFEVKFKGVRATRRFMIQPTRISSYTRKDDKAVLERWMASRGFIAPDGQA